MANHIPTRRVTNEDIESLDDVIDAVRELVHNDGYDDGEHTDVMSYLSILLVAKPIIGWCDEYGDYHEEPLTIKADNKGNIYFNPTSLVIHISDSDAVAVNGQPQDAVIIKCANQHFDHIVLNNGNAITYKWLCPASVLRTESPLDEHFIDVKTMNNTELTININTIASIIDEG